MDVYDLDTWQRAIPHETFTRLRKESPVHFNPEPVGAGFWAVSKHADVVTISLVLHHLLPEDKRIALVEVRRILRSGGRLHVADWGRPSDPLMSAVFFVAQAIDGFDRTADHRAGRLPNFITAAGLGTVERYGRYRTAFGSLDLLVAARA